MTVRNHILGLAVLCGALVAACGGEAVIDDPGGSGGSTSTTPPSTSSSSSSSSSSSGSSSSTSSSSSSSSGQPDCDDLTKFYQEALGEAMACDTCTDEPEACEYLSGQQLTDECGCPAPVNANSGPAVTEAVQAYNAWTGAGCGPWYCGEPCAVSSDPTCASLGGCEGMCSP